MASSSFFAFFLLLSITISSPLILQIQARDSQFFSKVTSKPTETVVLPDKAAEQQSLVKTEPTQQPEFVPQNENGYGLYGHETGLNPPETDVVTDAPATYRSENYYNNDKNDDFTTDKYGNGNGNGESFYSKFGENEKYDTSNTDKDDLLNFDDVFDSSKDGKGETFYSNNNNGVGTEHYSTESIPNTQKNNNNYGEETYYNTDKSDRFGSQLGQTETYYNDNRFDNRFTDEMKTRYNAYRGESNAGERKGMSDTRFLENGKYYYDLDKEQNQYGNSKNTYSNPRYNRAYQSNEVVENGKYDDALYGNSRADKYEFNTMEEYEKSGLNNQYDP